MTNPEGQPLLPATNRQSAIGNLKSGLGHNHEPLNDHTRRFSRSRA